MSEAIGNTALVTAYFIDANGTLWVTGTGESEDHAIQAAVAACSKISGCEC